MQTIFILPCGSTSRKQKNPSWAHSFLIFSLCGPIIGAVFSTSHRPFPHTHTHTHTYTLASWFTTHHNTFIRHTIYVVAKLSWSGKTTSKEHTMSCCLFLSLVLYFPFHTFSSYLSLVSFLSASSSPRPTLTVSSMPYYLFTHFFFLFRLLPYLIMLLWFFVSILFQYFFPSLLLSSSGVLVLHSSSLGP